MSLLYSPDPPLGMCNEQNFVSDFRNVIADVNITITYSRCMDDNESSVKRSMQVAQKYSRSKHSRQALDEKNDLK